MASRKRSSAAAFFSEDVEEATTKRMKVTLLDQPMAIDASEAENTVRLVNARADFDVTLEPITAYGNSGMLRTYARIWPYEADGRTMVDTGAFRYFDVPKIKKFFLASNGDLGIARIKDGLLVFRLYAENTDPKSLISEPVGPAAMVDNTHMEDNIAFVPVLDPTLDVTVVEGLLVNDAFVLVLSDHLIYGMFKSDKCPLVLTKPIFDTQTTYVDMAAACDNCLVFTDMFNWLAIVELTDTGVFQFGYTTLANLEETWVCPPVYPVPADNWIPADSPEVWAPVSMETQLSVRMERMCQSSMMSVAISRMHVAISYLNRGVVFFCRNQPQTITLMEGKNVAIHNVAPSLYVVVEVMEHGCVISEMQVLAPREFGSINFLVELDFRFQEIYWDWKDTICQLRFKVIPEDGVPIKAASLLTLTKQDV